MSSIRNYIRIGSLGIVLIMFNTFLHFEDSSTRISSRHLQATGGVESNYAIDNELRILSFGTSRTWGSGMNNPKTEAFPGMLNARNEGIRASDSNYPAMCTYSMVGEYDIVDVITIEYMPMSFWGTRDSILLLGRRLRQRFPDATIIFLNVWTPHQFFHKPTATGLRKFVLDNTDMMGSPIIPKSALDDALQKTSNEDWEFYGFNEDWLQDAASDPLINGTVLSLATPNMEDPLLAILSVAPLYLSDMSHFSKLGHVWVKNRIVDILQKQGKTQSNNINPWGSTDQCLSWFETGKSPMASNMPMVEFSPTKFAYEADTEKKVNFIELVNNNPHPQYLYISHMSTGPQAFYPQVIVEIHSNTTELEMAKEMSYDETHIRNATSSKHVSTCYNETPPQMPIHVVSHRYIGEVPVGRSFLNMKPDTDTKYPFRTVGIILAPSAFGEKVDYIF